MSIPLYCLSLSGWYGEKKTQGSYNKRQKKSFVLLVMEVAEHIRKEIAGRPTQQIFLHFFLNRSKSKLSEKKKNILNNTQRKKNKVVYISGKAQEAWLLKRYW